MDLRIIMIKAIWLRSPAPLWVALGIGALGSLWLGHTATALLHKPTADQASINNLGQPPLSLPVAIDTAEVRALNLFGKFIAEQPMNTAALPITNLNLKLSGIIASAHPEASRSLIAEEGKPPKTYFKGDTLGSGATLYAIAADFVVIQRGDGFEKLSLYQASQMSTPPRHLPPAAVVAETVPTAPIPSALQAPPTEIVYKSLEDRIATLRKKNSS